MTAAPLPLAGWPPLPEPPAQRPDEPAAHYGARLLAWLLDHATYATASDLQLELADAAAARTVTALYTDATRERISSIRHVIASTLRARRQRADDIAQFTETELARALAGRGHTPPPDVPGGSRVPVVHPVPVVPPAGAAKRL